MAKIFTVKRDLYIDYAKGIATLSVIFIHTTFWSGQLYAPKEIRILSLLFDVPIFFVLSGLTSSGNIEKTFQRLVKLQITYMIFVTGLFLFDSFFKVFLQTFFNAETYRNFFLTFGTKYTENTLSHPFDFRILGNWWIHQYFNCDVFPVVMGSFWYLKTYFLVTIFGVLSIRFFQKHFFWIIAFCTFLTLIFNLLPNHYPSGQTGYITFYLSIFLLAFQLKNKRLNFNQLWISTGLVVFSFISMFWHYGWGIFYLINKRKFPPQIPYIVWSMLSLLIIFSLYNRLRFNKENLFSFIGKNAIFFYFAQGISSSLVYFIANILKEKINWSILILLIFGINVILAFFIAKFLKKTDQFGWKFLEFLRQKIS